MAPFIREARSEADFLGFGGLIREYVAWCRERYFETPCFVEMAFSHQSLDSELAQLRLSYGPPNGKTLLAVFDGEVQGCAAYRTLGMGVCEMKRMFVPSRFHGQGLGRRLGEALIAQAQADGFCTMRLDTGNLMTEACAMYRALGFVACPPYIDYPERITPLILFMEKALTG